MKRPIHLTLLSALALAALALVPADLHAASPSFDIRPIGTLGGSESESTDINNRGDVVGYSARADGRIRGFLFTDGAMQELPSLGGFSQAWAINDSGWIVGQCFTPLGSFTPHATLWIDGVPRDLGLFPDGRTSEALGVNNRGQVVGYATRTDGEGIERRIPVLWNKGRMVALPTIDGGEGVANAINERGDIVGWVSNGPAYFAALWKHRQLQVLPTVGDSFSEAASVNARGTIVGTAFLGDETGSAMLTVKRASFIHGFLSDVNDHDVAVGSRPVEDAEGRHFPGLWIEKGKQVVITPEGGDNLLLAGVNNEGQAAGALVDGETLARVAAIVTRTKGGPKQPKGGPKHPKGPGGH